MPTFQIKNRFTNMVQFECELSAEVAEHSYGLRLGFAVRKAIEADADLRGANLRGADLRGTDLRGADFTDADLGDADLAGADLRGADLTDADLRGANFAGADLMGANFTGADLTDADLAGANLAHADLATIRNDLWDVLLRARGEVGELLDALRAGKIDGSVYEGECACLVGTIANVRGVSYDNLGHGLDPDADRPAERWFWAIRPGDTPTTSQVAKITEGWIVEFLGLIGGGVSGGMATSVPRHDRP